MSHLVLTMEQCLNRIEFNQKKCRELLDGEGN